jgi:hypothetical protein
MMLPVLQQLAAEHRGRLAVVKVRRRCLCLPPRVASNAALPQLHLLQLSQDVATLHHSLGH